MSDGKTKNYFGLRLIIRIQVSMTLMGLVSLSQGIPQEVAIIKPNPTLLRGGLVFSMENKAGPINVNQDIYQVTRTVSTDSLVRGLQATFDAYYQYRDHCQKVAEYVQRAGKTEPATTMAPKVYDHSDPKEWAGRPLGGWKIIHTTQKQKLLDAPAICKSKNGRLPEIRDKAQKDRLRAYMSTYNIYQCFAGVQMDKDTGVWRYQSDMGLAEDNPVMYEASYGGDWETWDQKDYWKKDIVRAQAAAYAVVYADPDGDFRMRILKNSDRGGMDLIVCEVPEEAPQSPEVEEKMSMMVMMAHHACIRDEQALKDKTEGQKRDIELMMKINFHINSTNSVLPVLVPKGFYNWEDDKRKRRNLPPHDYENMFERTDGSNSIHTVEKTVVLNKDQPQHQRQLLEQSIAQPSQQPNQDLAHKDQLEHQSRLQQRDLPISSGDWDRLMRDKRAAPAGLPLMVAGGAANVIYSMIEGGAPLSWTGDMIGSIFGWASSAEVKTLKKTMTDQGKTLAALQFNQAQIDKVVSNVISEVENTTKELIHIVLSTQVGMAMKAAEEDLKSINRQLTTNNDITILRFANILTSTRSGKASPFVITNEELEELAKRAKEEKDIILDIDLNNIRVMMTLIDNDIQIFFDIPAKNEDRLFTFYKITPLPHFQENATLVPKIDANYIAISVANSEYHTVDTDEFNRCTDTPHQCRVASPVIPLTDDAHCVIKTYITSQISCVLEETNIPRRPFIRSIGNHTIFSVPEATNIFIKCNNPWTVGHNQDTNTVLKGMGDLTFRPGCQITLPDGAKWDTPDIYPQVQMKQNMPLYSPYNTLPMATNVTVEYFKKADLQQPQIIYIQQHVQEEEELDTVKELVTEAFTNKNTLIPFMMRTSATIATIIVAVLLTLCMYVSCRVHCSGSKWLPCIKPFPEPDAEMRSVKEQVQLVQRQLKASYKSFKDTSLSLTDRCVQPNVEGRTANQKSAESAEENGIELVRQPTAPILKQREVTFGTNGIERY